MRYASLFAGIGGLESDEVRPMAAVEIDRACHLFLQRRLAAGGGSMELHDDVTTYHPPELDVVAGGWPCQDISVGGKQAGLAGARSGLFYQLLRVAVEAKASTIVAENVPHLVTMNGGAVFSEVLKAFHEAGFSHVGWRTLNARAFGLPHQRRRVIIVASKSPGPVDALHRPLPAIAPVQTFPADGFYWTAGSQSICYSQGFVPTLKVGSALSIPSPPAVTYGDVVRKLSAHEALRLQGFHPGDFGGAKESDLYRMAGNAVAVPMGHFALGSATAAPGAWLALLPKKAITSGKAFTADGVYGHGSLNPTQVVHPEPVLASNLADFLDLNTGDRLSPRAASGLLRRLGRSGKDCPDHLRALLEARMEA